MLVAIEQNNLDSSRNTWKSIETCSKEELAEWLAECWNESGNERTAGYWHNSKHVEQSFKRISQIPAELMDKAREGEVYKISRSCDKSETPVYLISPSFDEIIERFSTSDWGNYSLSMEN